MCSDRLALPVPEIAADIDKVEVPIEN